MCRSRGGFTTTFHTNADGRCHPPSVIVTPGQRADCMPFIAVMEKIRVPRLGPREPVRSQMWALRDSDILRGYFEASSMASKMSASVSFCQLGRSCQSAT